MSDPSEEKGVIIFGRDITKIPCFRNSYLYGLSSGLVAGLAYFLFTSKPRVASHVGVGCFATVTMTYWFYCRYNYSKAKFEMMRLQELLKHQAMYEGTAEEARLKELAKLKDSFEKK